MTTAKRRKVLLAICAMALVAYAIHYAQFGSGSVGPAEAKADVALAEYGVQGQAEGSPADERRSGPPPAQYGGVARRLDDFAADVAPDGQGLFDRDAFQASAALSGRVEEPPAAAKADVEPVVQAVEDAYRLQAVLVGPDGGSAIINGHFVKVGERLDSLQLIAVNDYAAVLLSNGTAVTLRLARTRQQEEAGGKAIPNPDASGLKPRPAGRE